MQSQIRSHRAQSKIGASRARAIKAWGGAKRSSSCGVDSCAFQVGKADPTGGTGALSFQNGHLYAVFITAP